MSSLTRNIEFLQFETANRSFCLDADQVLGVISLPQHLKEAPSVLPFRGESIPVYSLGKILGLEEKTRFSPPEVIAIRCDGNRFGIEVDWVGEIHKVLFQRSVFRLPDAAATKIKMFGVWGMAKLGKKLSLVLEPLSLLSKIRGADLFTHLPEAVQEGILQSTASPP